MSIEPTNFDERLDEILAVAMVNAMHEDWNNKKTLSEAKQAITELFLSIVGEDEPSKARPDKLKQSPPWQRNQLRQQIRTTITGKEGIDE